MKQTVAIHGDSILKQFRTMESYNLGQESLSCIASSSLTRNFASVRMPQHNAEKEYLHNIRFIYNHAD